MQNSTVSHNELKLTVMGCAAFTNKILRLNPSTRRQIFDYFDSSLIIDGDQIFIFNKECKLSREYSLQRNTADDMYDTIYARFENLYTIDK
jgi:hypothetical protein